jgi:O-methyltransferase
MNKYAGESTMQTLKRHIKRVINSFGYDICKIAQDKKIEMPIELRAEEQEIVHYVKRNGLSMVSDERLFSTAMACRHVIDRNVEGAFVECGVWRGGNAIIAAAIFELYKSDRKVYLYDTFKGMTEPTSADKYSATNAPVLETYLEHQREEHNEWAYVPIEKVRDNFADAGLSDDNLVFIQGDVLRTLQVEGNLPDKIAVLRLDTDWYESTKVELEVLYPRMNVGGVLMIDDYGYFTGSRKATDEYFTTHGRRPFLQYIDGTGRAGVKFD